MHPATSVQRGSAFDVRVSRDASYQALYEPGLLRRYGEALREQCGLAAAVVLTDARVHGLYGAAFGQSLRAAGYVPRFITVREGESSKSVARYESVLHQLIELGLDRRGILINFGGGVVSDLGGFVAATYMRGIRYVNFATSLIGQVDAAVGGKVAVNSTHAKNIIGAFHHPSHVGADAELIGTVSARDFRSGIAEAIKVGVIASPELFGLLEREQPALCMREPAVLNRACWLAAKVKMELIARDPYECDLRRPLNFGHTLGHPIETDYAYQDVRHGEAVAIGMGVATLIARRSGTIGREDALRLFGLLDAYDLIGCVGPLVPASIVARLRCVRLIRGNELLFVLPAGIGATQIERDLDEGTIVLAFERYEQLAQRRREGLDWRELV